MHAQQVRYANRAFTDEGRGYATTRVANAATESESWTRAEMAHTAGEGNQSMSSPDPDPSGSCVSKHRGTATVSLSLGPPRPTWRTKFSMGTDYWQMLPV